MSLYTDRGAHYFYTPTAGGEVDRSRPTQVGRALERLGVEHIAAHPGNIALAIKLLGITLKQNDFSGRTEIAGCPDSGRISLMRELSESASRFMKPSALCHRCNCSSTP
jgi:hypothetical protein